MEIGKLSGAYRVCALGEGEIGSVLELCRGNPLFYEHCPPAPTAESIARDMVVLPPRTRPEDKYYLGFYEGRKLVAVLDLILNYPNTQTAFIGFFMVAADRQNRGVGSALVRDILDCLDGWGYEFTRLAYVLGNPQSRAFWLKNGFAETGVRTSTEDYTMVVMQRSNRCYYKAYDQRYRAIHDRNHTWAAETSTPMVLKILGKYGISKEEPLLEVGCGEGRDSIALLRAGYDLTATDVSGEAVRYCRKKFPEFGACFTLADVCRDRLDRQFRFIFATSVLHMLVEDRDRQGFWTFFRTHLSEGGLGLVLTMGDGTAEFRTDPSRAYELQERTNNAGRIPVLVPSTSCRMVSFATLDREIRAAGLKMVESGITQSLPDFDSLMYAVVAKEQ